MPASPITPRRITAVASLVVAAVLLLGGLYVARVTDRLSDLRARNFRIAATLAEVAERKLNNVGDVLESRARAAGTDARQRYRQPPCFDHVGEHEGAEKEDGSESGEAHGAHAPQKSAQIHVDHGAGKLDFYFFPKAQEAGRPLHAEAEVGCLFAALERPDVFDDLVVLDSDGKRVFQAGGSGARLHEFSVVPADGGGASPADGGDEETEEGLAAVSITSFSELELAGEPYAFFRQPVRLAFVRGEGEEGGRPAVWEVVGLVRSDRLVSDAMRLAPSTLIVLVAVLVLILCAWPFVKLLATGRRERIEPRDVLWVDLSLAVASALLAVAALDVGFHARQQRDLEGSLAEGARQIESSFQEDLGAGLAQLRILGDDYPPPIEDAEDARGDGGLVGGGLVPGGSSPGYPHLEMVFWTDACGNQVAKWAVGDPTPLISVAGREYFQRARDRRLWSPPRGSQEGNRAGRLYFVQPIRSWTTGAQELILAVPYGARRPAEECEEEMEVLGPPIAAMSVIDPPSMFRPVLPPGRGFAVLDRTGRVVLHSETERNGLEDFVEEAEGSPELRAALFSRTAQDFRASYRGREHQMHSRPLSGLPWQLVVFEERSLRQTVNLEAMMAALLLVFLELLVVGAAMGVIRLAGGHGSLRSLWPAPDDLATYARMMAVSLLVAVSFLVTLLVFSSTASLVVTGLCLPLVAVGLIVAAATPPGEGWVGRRYSALAVAAVGGLALLGHGTWELVGGEGDWRERLVLLLHVTTLAVSFVLTRSRLRLPAVTRRWLTPVVLFLLASGLTLAVVGALPAAGFLQASYQERLALEVRRGQLHLGRALLERGRWVEEEYAGVSEAAEADGRGSVIEDVLAEERDIHDYGYFDTRHTYDTCSSAPADDCGPQPERRVGAERGSLPDLAEGARTTDAVRSRPEPPAVWTLSLLPFFNRHSAEARAWARLEPSAGGGGESDPDEASQLSLWPPKEAPGKGQLFLQVRSPTGDREARVASAAPRVTLVGGGTEGLWRLVAVALVSGGLILAALAFLARRLFHVDFRLPRLTTVEDLDKRRFTRLLGVVPPSTVTDGLFKDAALRVDLEEAGTAGDRRELEQLKELPEEGLVVVDHLEGVLDDGRSRDEGLPIFEYVLAWTGGDMRLAVLAHRDPRAVLDVEEERLCEVVEAEAASAEEVAEARKGLATVARWRELLERFAERWVADTGNPRRLEDEIVRHREGGGSGIWRLLDVSSGPARQALTVLWEECRWSRPLQQAGFELLEDPGFVGLDADEVIDRVGEDAGDYYRSLWAGLARDERHVLAQLACGCLVNRGLKGPLERLLTWGLVTRDPSTFRVMNESFRRFVLGHHDPAALLAWEAEGSVSFWRQVRVPFFTVLAIAGLFLLVTQRDLFNLTMALASAGVMALPGLLKLLGWFRGGRGVSGAAEA